LAGCRRPVQAVDAAPVSDQPAATISGTVRGGPEGKGEVDGRTVEAVNVETGERHRVTTSSGGSYSLKVKPGRYRVELALRQGEAIVRQPGVILLNQLDRDAHADFVLRPSYVSRPRGPAYRGDDGLGSPIA
jgi:hypothetical protein